MKDPSNALHKNGTGVLYLVATPIGNLQDITLRALKTLEEVDFIAAEDTRQTAKLLNHFGIKKPLISYYEYNKAERGSYLIAQLCEGKKAALVSDAGTPGISDPGEDLVRLAIKNNIAVTMIPGPSAAIMGLVLSGMQTGRFVFEGFLPMNKRSRRERLLSLKNESRTVILYEAPHKLVHTLKDLFEVLGDRRIAIARELTKRYEEISRCSLSEAIEMYAAKTPKGEFVLILEGASEDGFLDEQREKWADMSLEEHFRYYLDRGCNRKEAVKKISIDRGLSKREVYNSLLKDDKKGV